MIKLYVGEPVSVHWFTTLATGGEAAVEGVVEIAETTAGSLLISTANERMLCPAGTWSRLVWPVLP